MKVTFAAAVNFNETWPFLTQSKVKPSALGSYCTGRMPGYSIAVGFWSIASLQAAQHNCKCRVNMLAQSPWHAVTKGQCSGKLTR